MGVSPAAIVALPVLAELMDDNEPRPRYRQSRKSPRLAVLGPQDLGPQHALVEVELEVELLDGARVRGQIDDGVDAFRLLVDRVGEPALPPDVELADLAAIGGDDLEEPLERRLDRPLLEVRVEDDHNFVVAHARSSSGLTRSRPFRDRRVQVWGFTSPSAAPNCTKALR